MLLEFINNITSQMADGNIDTAVNFYFDMGASLPAPHQTPPPQAGRPPEAIKTPTRVYPIPQDEEEDDIPDIRGLDIRKEAPSRPGRPFFDEDGIRSADPARIQRLYDGRGIADTGFFERDTSGSKDEVGVDWMYPLQTELCYPGDLTAVKNSFAQIIVQLCHIYQPNDDVCCGPRRRERQKDLQNGSL